MSYASGTVLLHSKYDPVKEAARFVDAQKISFIPAFIVVSEPGESYLAAEFRLRFPKAALIALRYHPSLFSEFDQLWDFIWRPESTHGINDFLLNHIPDEYLPLTIFLSWKPSDILWPEVSRLVWLGIASVIKIQSSIMYTRNHFGPRWLTNMIKNTILIKSVLHPITTSKNIFLASAGPTLEKQFPFDNKNWYICAVSASISCLQYHNCKPDICLATDGGYWALEHFRNIAEAVPVAFPLEAAIPSAVLEKNSAVILNYGSKLEMALISIIGIKSENAFRNGTVSGTAAMYALSHSTGLICASGLDLKTSNSFTHARPYSSDSAVNNNSDRFHPLASILYSRNLESLSLDMYASWFESRDDNFKKRFFRLLPEGKKISGIKSLSISEVQRTKKYEPPGMRQQEVNGRKRRVVELLSFLADLKNGLINYSDPEYYKLEQKKICQDILEDSLFVEIMQMVSYTDYIHLLKQFNISSLSVDVSITVSALCKKTVRFLEKLISMVQTYE